MSVPCDVNSLSILASKLSGSLNPAQLDAIKTRQLCKVLTGGGAGPGDEDYFLMTEDESGALATEQSNNLEQEH